MVFTFGFLILLWWGAAWVLPFPDHLLAQSPENLVVTDASGRPLRRVLGAEGMDAVWLPLNEIGEWNQSAIISVEDKRFHSHAGVDPVAVTRAVGQNFAGRRVVSGASTLSTQVIRLIEPRERTLWTKLVEAFRATQLELRYDKDFILEQYLNRAPYGGNVQGVGAAAQRYYGKSPAALSAGEAALLAGLPQSPSRFRPDRHPERAERRRETVLRRMTEEGVLADIPLLDSGPLRVPPPFEAPHYVDWILQQDPGHTGVLETTLDGATQKLLEEVAQNARAHPRNVDLDGIALLVMDARDGSILGWVGGWDHAHPQHGQVNTVTRRRAPGSALKPFAYALAMQQGWLTPDTLVEDRPRAWRDYRPRNMDRHHDGEVTAAEALSRSLNLPALAITERLTAPVWTDHLRALGFALPGVTPEKTGLGSVIGGGVEVSLLELVGAYRGFRISDFGFRIEVETYSSGVCWWITRALGGGERDHFLHGHAGEVDAPPLAWKTGTSNGHRDAWAVGWNERMVIGVWLGRMDNRGVAGLTGAAHAGPVLGEIARELMRGQSLPARPEDVREWRGREIVAGVTDPLLLPPPGNRFHIVSPTPDLELHVEQGEARLPLRAVGAEAAEVNWFVNDEWIGANPGAYNFAAGEHTVRAVTPDGRAASTRLMIR